MKRNRNYFLQLTNNGRTSVETLTTMLLLIMLGVGLFSLALSTVSLYQRQYENKFDTSELRVASSFIATKIRQNDMTGCLNIMSDPLNGKNALVIYEEIGDQRYATWIFHFEGILYEALVLSDELPSVEISQPVAEIDSFEISYDAKKHGIYTVGKNGDKSYESFIKLRTKFAGEKN